FRRNGNFTFNGTVTGDALADFMLGLPNDFTQSDTLDNATRATIFALYVQDSIKLTRNFTINAGLRWEPTFPAYDYFARGDSFSRDAFTAGRRSTKFTNAPLGLLFYGDEGVPKSYSQGSAFVLAPRHGILWVLKGD